MRRPMMRLSESHTSEIAWACWFGELTSSGEVRRCGGPYVIPSPLPDSFLSTLCSQFNTPLQLGPASSTPPSAAQVITLPVCADDILVLASDGLSDNLWDEEILDEVVRFRRTFLASPLANGSQLPRRTLAGMLSEALCSRARNVSQRRSNMTPIAETMSMILDTDDEIPFSRRAHEEGRVFTGGKPDGESFRARSETSSFSHATDISV